jgi:hypothetical protein
MCKWENDIQLCLNILDKEMWNCFMCLSAGKGWAEQLSEYIIEASSIATELGSYLHIIMWRIILYITASMSWNFVTSVLRPVNSYYISLKRTDRKIKERLAWTEPNHLSQTRYCNELLSLTCIYIYKNLTLVFLFLAVIITASTQIEVQ